MAELRFHLYQRARDELAPLTSGEPPRWAVRVYESYGGTASRYPPSAAVEALGESLGRRLSGLAFIMRKAEERHWLVDFDGDTVTISSTESATRTRELMEIDGVWDLASRFYSPEGDVA
jgi:hypothetical protein